MGCNQEISCGKDEMCSLQATVVIASKRTSLAFFLDTDQFVPMGVSKALDPRACFAGGSCH